MLLSYDSDRGIGVIDEITVFVAEPEVVVTVGGSALKYGVVDPLVLGVLTQPRPVVCIIIVPDPDLSSTLAEIAEELESHIDDLPRLLYSTRLGNRSTLP